MPSSNFHAWRASGFTGLFTPLPQVFQSSCTSNPQSALCKPSLAMGHSYLTGPTASTIMSSFSGRHPVSTPPNLCLPLKFPRWTNPGTCATQGGDVCPLITTIKSSALTFEEADQSIKSFSNYRLPPPTNQPSNPLYT